MYDYLVVGAGLYGAVFAQEAKRAGKSVLVIDKRPHVAGNIYTEKIEGIHVLPHKQQAGVGIYHAVCRLQSVYQQSGSQLQGRAVFDAV